MHLSGEDAFVSAFTLYPKDWSPDFHIVVRMNVTMPSAHNLVQSPRAYDFANPRGFFLPPIGNAVGYSVPLHTLLMRPTTLGVLMMPAN